MKRWCYDCCFVKKRTGEQDTRIPLITVKDADERIKVFMDKLKERDVIIPFKRLRTQPMIDEETVTMAIVDGMFDTRRVDMENMYGYDSIRDWIRTEFRQNDRSAAALVQMMNRDRVMIKIKKGGEWYFFTEWVCRKINI